MVVGVRHAGGQLGGPSSPLRTLRDQIAKALGHGPPGSGAASPGLLGSAAKRRRGKPRITLMTHTEDEDAEALAAQDAHQAADASEGQAVSASARRGAGGAGGTEQLETVVSGWL